MKKIFLAIFLLFVFLGSAYTQEMTFYFKNLHRQSMETDGNTNPLYKMTFDTLKVRDKRYPVKFPNMLNSKDTTFLKEYFTGWENAPLVRETMFLIGNYKSDTTYVWADLNNNLDFTDDNALFIITKENPYMFVGLPNSKNNEGKFWYRFGKVHYKNEESKQSVIEHYFNDDKKKGFVTADPDYWFKVLRLNILSCDTVIDGNKVQLGLMDWNCNGLYNDVSTLTNNNFSSDRILVGRYGSEIISDRLSAGAVALLQKTDIPINGKVYEVVEIEPTGKYLKIRKTDRTYSVLKAGDDFPDLEFKLMNGEKTSLGKQLAKGKYNLIDIWGFWCSGCIFRMPQLKKLDSLYSAKLNIIGLHDYRSSKEQAKKTAEKYKIKYINGFLTPEIEKNLLADKYPYYVLIDPEGKIYQLDITLEKVEEIISRQ